MRLPNKIADNGYKIGSLAWIERCNYLAVRGILQMLLDGEITKEQAKEELWCMDTDSITN